jgi:uncharacterized protein with NRDE domain
VCLALVALGAHDRYAAVIAANRDEFHARATAPAGWWHEGWLAGRDLTAGGTWLGVTRTGRWALITNVREPGRHDPAAPSRGALVTSALADAAPAAEAVGRIVRDAARYNGFNLVAGTTRDAHWGSNRAEAPHALAEGVHGISNALLETPWPKVTRTKAAFARWCARDDADVDALFALLGDRGIAPDDELPATGIALDRERMLSAPFIVSPEYGTRSSSVLAIGYDGEARFMERSFDPAGRTTVVVDERFRLAE